MIQVDIAILGCGWTGILLANKYAQSHSVLCIDGAEQLGGLMRSENIKGFTIDIGGSHVIFSKDPKLLDKILSFLGDNIVVHERRSYVLLNNLFIPYPFENGLYVLPLEDRVEALMHFIEALLSLDRDWRPRNLEEWLYGAFGKWIAEKYLVPYNRKIWKRPLNRIDIDWIYTPGRLPLPNWRDIVKSALGLPTQGYLEQAKFYYPLKGGIQSLYNSVYAKAINKGAIVMSKNRVTSIVFDNDGTIVINSKIKARKVINTIPIPELINSLSDEIYSDLKEYVKYFDYNKVVTVALALNRSSPQHHWIYVPDEKYIFHRYSWLSNYSPYNAPQGSSLILAEITVPFSENVVLDYTVEKTIGDLERLSIIESKDIVFVKAWINEYGYPIHDLELYSARTYVLSYLRSLGIVSLGRWGSWRYLNMDSIVKDVEQLSI